MSDDGGEEESFVDGVDLVCYASLGQEGAGGLFDVLRMVCQAGWLRVFRVLETSSLGDG